MATAIPKNSVWSAMNYPPPKGRCNYKTSLMSPACPCLRFMLHPVKAATSFECDGCNHHASFHSLENPTEDAIIARWEQQEAEGKMERQAITGASKKRKRIADKPANEIAMPGMFEIVDVTDEVDEEGKDSEVEMVVASAAQSTRGTRATKMGTLKAPTIRSKKM